MSTSDYKSDADRAKEKLETVSPTMCLAKWNQTSLHLPTGKTNSCYHPPLHKISPDKLNYNPASLHNTAEKLQQRKEMLEGKKPEGCSYCWNIEKTGEMSDRHYRSGEPWAMQDFDDIMKKPLDDKWTPRYVEVNFNNAAISSVVTAHHSSPPRGARKSIVMENIQRHLLTTCRNTFKERAGPCQIESIIHTLMLSGDGGQLCTRISNTSV